MSQKTQTATSFPSFSRFGLGIALRPPSRTDEEWYIPYEVPKTMLRTPSRDSWGELDDPEMIIGHTNHRDRYSTTGPNTGDTRRYEYGGWTSARTNASPNGGDADFARDRQPRRGMPVLSTLSMLSSIPASPISPISPVTITPNRRSGYGSTLPTTAPSTVVGSTMAVGGGGGIGECPTPTVRTNHRQQGARPPSNAPWTHFSQFLPFNSSPRRTVIIPPPDSGDPFSQKIHPYARQSEVRPIPESQVQVHAHIVKPRPQAGLAVLDPSSIQRDLAPTDEDYYDSYYSTLLATPNAPEQRPRSPKRGRRRRGSSVTQTVINGNAPQGVQDRPVSEQPQNKTSASSKPHPYAYVFPSAALGVEPHPPPTQVATSTQSASKTRGTLAVSEEGAYPTHLAHTRAGGPLTALKSSISVPNLRAHSERPPAPVNRDEGTGASRWLSAETWCDALIFPRPRFKVEHAREDGPARSAGSPEKRRRQSTSVEGSAAGTGTLTSLTSRQLDQISAGCAPAAAAGSSPKQMRRRNVTLPGSLGKRPSTAPGTSREGASQEDAGGAAGRESSTFAKDDMALPSPTPSLDRYVLPKDHLLIGGFFDRLFFCRVLEEGATLEVERQAWQRQAAQSFQNKRSRSLSRTRSKSFTHGRTRSQRRGGTDKASGSNTDATGSVQIRSDPTHIRPRRGNSRGKPNSARGGTVPPPPSTANSHSRASHHARTSSKSSSGKSHSRASSWSKSALKLAKASPFGVLCGVGGGAGAPPSPPSEGAGALERAIKSHGTKRVRLGQPLEMEERWRDGQQSTSPRRTTPETLEARNTASPSPSSENVGVALSTSEADLPSIRMPDHPYSTAYSPCVSPVAESDRRPSVKVDYAGPHPVETPVLSHRPSLNDVSTRHRLPPHAMLHPYAQGADPPPASTSASSEAVIRTRPRSDSLVPPAEKLWVPGPSGEVHEVLAEEIQYSPYIPEALSPVEGHYPIPHAYILPDKNRETKLQADDVLDSAFGVTRREEETHEADVKQPEAPREVDLAIESNLPEVHRREELLTPVSPTSNHSPQAARRKPVNYNRSTRPTFSDTATTSSLDVLHPMRARAEIRSEIRDEDSSGSSPLVASPQSARPLYSADDLDRFRDLFYRPGQPASDGGPSSRARASNNEDIPWDVGSSRSASGLTTLARQLSEELEGLAAQSELPEEPALKPPSPFRGRPSTTTSTELRFILREISTTRPESPPGVMLSLSLQDGPGRSTNNVPSDVESSRASSVLEPAHDGEDTVGEFVY
jgi:serine/arginine repetitive matrix protein 2